MFWESFCALCKANGTNPSAVTADLGFSSSVVTKWKNGSTPRSSTLSQLAEYFGVSVNCLLGYEPVTSGDPEKVAKVQELSKLLMNLNAEDLQTAARIISAMAEAEKNKP